MVQEHNKALETLALEFEKKLTARRDKGEKKLKKIISEGFWPGSTCNSILQVELREAVKKGLKPSEFFLENFPSFFGSYLPERFRDAFLWAVDACRERPCQTGWSRRPIRSSRYEDYVDVVAFVFHKFWRCCAFDEELADILAGSLPQDAKAYSARHAVSGFTPELIAYALNHGDVTVEKLIRASFNGDPGAMTANPELFQGVLLSQNRSLQEQLGKLLLAASLQEGLRQAICESADEGTLEGFRGVLKIVNDANLLRFSSVKRAAAVWTGLGTPDSRNLERISAKTLQLMLEGLDNESSLADATRSEDVMALYMALWSLALRDQHKAVEVAEETLRTCSRHQTLTCGFFASTLQNDALCHRLALSAVMKNPQDQELLALVLPLLCGCYRYDKLRDYRKDGTRLNLSTWFRDKQEARALFDLLSASLESLKVKTKTFPRCVFPWLDVTLTQSDLAATICYVALLLEEDDALDHALAVAPLICADDRGYYFGALLARPKRDSQIRALHAALVEKESRTRSHAFDIANKLPVASLDFAELEKNLRLKTVDIRDACIALLMKQENATLFASFERLLDDSNEQRRRAAYDLAIRIADDQERSELKEPCAKLLRDHEPKDPKERLPRNAALRAIDPEWNKEATVPKLFDESDAYNPDVQFLADDLRLLEAFLRFYPDSEIATNPTISNAELAQRRAKNKRAEVSASCAQAREDAKALDKLIEEHKEDSVETPSGEKVMFGFVKLDSPSNYFRSQKPFPLAELWERWLASLGSPDRLARVVSILFAEASSLDDRIDFLCGKGFSEPQKFAYKDTALRICSYLWKKHGDTKTLEEASLAAAEWFV